MLKSVIFKSTNLIINKQPPTFKPRTLPWTPNLVGEVIEKEGVEKGVSETQPPVNWEAITSVAMDTYNCTYTI